MESKGPPGIFLNVGQFSSTSQPFADSFGSTIAAAHRTASDSTGLLVVLVDCGRVEAP